MFKTVVNDDVRLGEGRSSNLRLPRIFHVQTPFEVRSNNGNGIEGAKRQSSVHWPQPGTCRMAQHAAALFPILQK